MTLPASYREQRACANCRHAKHGSETSAGYCALLGPSEPEYEGVEYATYHQAFHDWGRRRIIEWHYTCDEHEARA